MSERVDQIKKIISNWDSVIVDKGLIEDIALAIDEEIEKEIDELLSLIDGASVTVELFKAESHAQNAWKENWLRMARAALGEE